MAGNPSPLFFGCVLGRLCRGWEHLLPLSFLLFLFSLLSLPLPPVGTLEWDATRGSTRCQEATLTLLGAPGLATGCKDALGAEMPPVGEACDPSKLS